jgi:hypothetical protein
MAPHAVWTSYRIEQHHDQAHAPNAGYLGRHVEHDPRSLAYEISADLLPDSPVTVRHTRQIPILDQGQVGSCTGNDATGRVGTDPNYSPIPASNKYKPSATDADADETEARDTVYHMATQLDNVPGTYPAQDTGSTGLAAAKAVQKLGLISGYQHGFDLDTALKALSVMPLGIGAAWKTSQDEPDSNGLVRYTGSTRGGHQFTADEIIVEKKLVGFSNSWGLSYGVQGRFYMGWDDFGAMLDNDGDVIMYVPLSSPSPTPTPTPTPSDVDKALHDIITLAQGALGTA